MNVCFNILLPLGLAAMISPVMAGLTVYVSPNDIESAEDSGIVNVSTQVFTENFNTHPVGSIDGYTSPTIGVTYTSTGGAQVLSNDQYGGHNEGNYLGISSGSQATLTLAAPAQYFGFYFSAGDVNNSIEIYSGDTLLTTFSTATLIAMLPDTAGTQITALNGSSYNTIDYYGKPGTNENGGEPYAYLHFIANGGTTFDRIVLKQGEKSIFENDNHSILATAPVIPETLVKVQDLIPEPSVALLSGMGALALLRRRRVG